MTRPEFWLSSLEPDPHEAYVLARMRRTRCAYCAKKATRPDGCCNECTSVEVDAAMERHPAGKKLGETA